MNNSVFGKTMENMRKHRGIKIVTTEEKRIKLVSQPNYHTTKQFSEKLLAIEMKNTKVKMNRPIYLGMSILDISKTLIYEFWHDYIKPKYKDKAKLLKIFLKILTMMLKDGLIHLTTTRMTKDHSKQA